MSTEERNEVPAPMFISSRLMAALRMDDGSTVHVSADGQWAVDGPSGVELGESTGGDEIGWGAGGFPGYAEAMSTLLSFLSACAESYPDGENADLFPVPVAKWADQHSDELSMAEFDLSEGR